jgi:hypothetical protein
VQNARRAGIDPSTGEDRGFESDLTDFAEPLSSDPSNRYKTSSLYCTFKAAVNPGPCVREDRSSMRVGLARRRA